MIIILSYDPKSKQAVIYLPIYGSDLFTKKMSLSGTGTLFFPYQWVQLQTYEFSTLFFMTGLRYHCILGLAEIKTLHPRAKIMSKRCRMRR